MNPQSQMLAALISKSLNLGPEWTVVDVEMRECDPEPDELHVYVERTPGHALKCPKCGAMHGAYDTRKRTWRHLDIWQYKTYIHCEVPRLDCGDGKPVTAEVPWAAPDAKHFTALFEAQVLVMAMSSMPVAGIAGVVREHDTRIWAMLGRIVSKAHAEADFSGVTDVGVDETARRRGHNYLTSFVDLDGERVMVCALGRDAGTVAEFARELEAHGGDPGAVAVVTCDLSPAFAKGVAEHLPNAERVADRFHVIQLATRQLDKVRAAEAKESKEKRALLSRTKYIWLKNESSLTEGQAERKRSLAKEHLKTSRACAMKEALQAVYECGTREEAESELDALCSWIMHSNVPQMKAVAKTIRENKAEILNYFDHRLTNAVLEGMNSVIQSAKRQARGFSNLEYFKTIIYLKLGKLHFPQLPACATH
ncbi:MAG: ISL3 family transposase [Eggerthellaceae bacterium]|nr:ISL3 family transposase [Eggerthellaceae bacterium]